MCALRCLAAATVLSLVASPAAAAPATPPERFVGRDTSMVFAFASLDTALEQLSGLYATATSFPGGERLEKKRAALQEEFGFDPLDRAWLEEAGIDAARPALIGLTALDVQGAVDDEEADLLFVLPIANPARFEKTLARLARGDRGLAPKSALPGAPRVTVYRPRKDGPSEYALAYAIAEGNAVLAIQARAIPRVAAALALPKPQQLATLPVYRGLTQQLGAGVGLVAFFLPGSPFVKGEPRLAGGYAVGLGGSASGVRLTMALPLPKDSPLLRGTAVDPAPLVGKLHPGSFLVGRNSTELRAFFSADDLLDPFGTKKSKISKSTRDIVSQLVAALGGGMALGVSAVEEAGSADRRPSVDKAPFAWFRGEMVLGVADPARMRSVIRKWLAELEPGQELSESGPWVFPASGGEIGLAVEKRKLLVAFGPEGTLKALAARDGTRFDPPTPASAKGLEEGPSGAYLDVPKFVERLRSLPASAFGAGSKGRRNHQTFQAILPMLSRFRELALRSDVVGSIMRLELSVEVEPAAAEAESDDASAEDGEDEGGWE